MIDVPLSQFPKNALVLQLGIKNSKNCVKRIKLGADEYESTSFSIYLNPFNPCSTFRFQRTGKGGLLLTQDPQGNIELKIAANVTLPASSTEPEDNYLYFERKYFSFQRKVVRQQGYIAIKSRKENGEINYVE